MRKNSSSTDATDPLIDAFIDSLWLEDGLSALTLAAYRRDLTALATWLTTQSSHLTSATEADLQAYFAHRHAQTRRPTIRPVRGHRHDPNPLGGEWRDHTRNLI